MKKLLPLTLFALLASCVCASAQFFNPVMYFPRLPGPCELVTCAEAYSVTRAMTVNYTGPLFQLSNGSSTLDIGQVDGKVDMSTWSAFCAGVPANCVYTKFYAQINTTANDLTPFNVGNKTPFTIEAATGLPIISDTQGVCCVVTNGYQYAVGGHSDNNSTGINAHGTAQSVLVVGHPLPVTSTFCCGVFGTAHVWNDGSCPPCTPGTDFEIVIGSNQAGANAVNCQTTVTFCIGADLEGGGDGADYSISAMDYIAAISFDPTGSSTLKGYVNGVNVVSNAPAASGLAGVSFTMNAGAHIHFAGGGDLSPASVIAREMLITNSALSVNQIAAITANVQNFYSALTFPTAPSRPAPYAAGPGDVVSGARYFVGLRAYSAAVAAAGTQKLIHVVNTSVTRNCDILVAANGGLGLTTSCSSGGDNGLTAVQFCGIITGVTGNGFNGGPNCIFDTLYDHTGNGFNFVANTGPHGFLLLRCLGFAPCLIPSTGAGLAQTPVWTSVPQPYTISLVTERSGAFTTAQVVLSHCGPACGGSGPLFEAGFNNAANQFFINTSTSATFPSVAATANDSSFHAIQGIYNSSSSVLFVDGTTTTGNVGTDAAVSSPTIKIGFDAFGTNGCSNCELTELGFWPLGFTGTQQTNMNANQHNYWGF